MIKYLLSLSICTLIVLSTSCTDQSDEITLKENINIPDDEIVKKADTYPFFAGCIDKECSDQKLIKYLSENLKYPEEAKKSGKEARVFVGLVIDKEGKVRNVKMMNEAEEVFTKEALRVVNSLNDVDEPWTPGTVDGKNVAVSYVLPITFAI